MAKTMPDNNKGKGLTEIYGEIHSEMRPADAREYLDRAFKVLIEIAEDPNKEIHARFHALKGIDSIYSTLVMKDGLDETVNKTTRVNQKMADNVREFRKKPWEEDENEGTESGDK